MAAGCYFAAPSVGSPDVTSANRLGAADVASTLILAAFTAAGMAAALGFWLWSAT